MLNGKALAHKAERAGGRLVFRFTELNLAEGNELRLRVQA
jgi:hypothetical protein